MEGESAAAQGGAVVGAAGGHALDGGVGYGLAERLVVWRGASRRWPSMDSGSAVAVVGDDLEAGGRRAGGRELASTSAPVHGRDRRAKPMLMERSMT